MVLESEFETLQFGGLEPPTSSGSNSLSGPSLVDDNDSVPTVPQTLLALKGTRWSEEETQLFLDLYKRNPRMTPAEMHKTLKTRTPKAIQGFRSRNISSLKIKGVEPPNPSKGRRSGPRVVVHAAPVELLPPPSPSLAPDSDIARERSEKRERVRWVENLQVCSEEEITKAAEETGFFPVLNVARIRKNKWEELNKKLEDECEWDRFGFYGMEKKKVFETEEEWKEFEDRVLLFVKWVYWNVVSILPTSEQQKVAKTHPELLKSPTLPERPSEPSFSSSSSSSRSRSTGNEAPLPRNCHWSLRLTQRMGLLNMGTETISPVTQITPPPSPSSPSSSVPPPDAPQSPLQNENRGVTASPPPSPPSEEERASSPLHDFQNRGVTALSTSPPNMVGPGNSRGADGMDLNPSDLNPENPSDSQGSDKEKGARKDTFWREMKQMKRRLGWMARLRFLIRNGMMRGSCFFSSRMGDLCNSLGMGRAKEELKRGNKTGWRVAYDMIGKKRGEERKKKSKLGRAWRRFRRSKEKKKMLFLWHNNRRAFYRKISSTTIPVVDDNIFKKAMDYYSEQNTSRNLSGFSVDGMLDEIVDELPFREIKIRKKDFWEITNWDIEFYLKKAKQNTAPGWDGMSNRIWKNLPELFYPMSSIFEVCRHNSRIPISWQLAKGTLLPKKQNLECGKDVRPIMMGQNLYKIFSGILGSKLLGFSNRTGIWSDEQRGFTELNGCMMNLSILQFARDNIRRNPGSHELYTLLVDIQNAFGSLEYHQLIAVLMGLGFPRDIGKLLWGMLRAGAMLFERDGETTAILQWRGVKQGDPISPIIFNLLLEPVWRILRRRKTGYKMIKGKGTLPALGFADDMAINTSSKGKMEEAVRMLCSVLDWLYLKLVPSKCALVKIMFKRSKMVEDDWTVLIDGQRVSIVSASGDELDTRYLGSWIDENPRSFTTLRNLVEKVEKRIEYLTVCALPLRFKIRALTEWVSSAANFVFMNERVDAVIIENLQRILNGCFRSWFNLPHNASIELLTLPLANYGINLPNFERMYRKLQCMKYDYLKNTKDPQVKQIVKDSLEESRKLRGADSAEFFGQDLGQSTERVKSFWSVLHDTATKYGSFDQEEVAEAINKRILSHAATTDLQGELIRTWNKVQSGSIPAYKKWMRRVSDCYLRFWVKASLQLLYTPTARMRAGIGNGNCFCGDTGTQLHILNNCRFRKFDMVKRHNRVQNVFQTFRPTDANEVIFVDKHIPPHLYGGDATVIKTKPDIFILNRFLKTINIIEFAVPYDTNIEVRYAEKTEKYKPIIRALKATNHDYYVDFFPIIIGALGGVHRDTPYLLRRTGITEQRAIRETIVRMRRVAIEGSLDIWNRRSKNNFNNTAGA